MSIFARPYGEMHPNALRALFNQQLVEICYIEKTANTHLFSLNPPPPRHGVTASHWVIPMVKWMYDGKKFLFRLMFYLIYIL